MNKEDIKRMIVGLVILRIGLKFIDEVQIEKSVVLGKKDKTE